MWLDNKVVSFWCNKSGKRYLFRIPENSSAIETGIKILHYLNEEELKNSFKIPRKSKKYFPKELLDERFKVGFLSRISSYVVSSCNLEDIVRISYQLLKDTITSLGCSKIILNDRKALKERDIEISNFRFWRNKVFAHTAYAFPSRYVPYKFLCKPCIQKVKDKNLTEHNFSIQLTSLSYFAGDMLQVGKNSYKLGGIAMVVNEQKPPNFPIIDILESHNLMLEHFNKWQKMFLAILDPFRALDMDEVKKKNKEIEKIILAPLK